MTYKQRCSTRRQLLNMSIGGKQSVTGAKLREIFSILRKQGYQLAGYAIQLERALERVKRAQAADKALETAQ